VDLHQRLIALSDKRPLCKVGQLMNSLDEETALALQQVLKSDVSTRSITEALREHGYKISKSTLGIHRSNECCCEVSHEPV